MGEQPSTLDRSSERFARALRLLEDLSGDAQAAAQLLALLGWGLPPAVADIGLTGLDIGNLVQRLEDLNALRSNEDTTDVEVAAALAEVLIAIEETLQGIDDLAAGLDASSDYLDRTNIEHEFFGRLADVLIIQAIGDVSPILVPISVLLGFVELTLMPADPTIFQVEHVRQVVHWDALGTLVTDPSDVMHDVYGWGTTEFDGARLITNLAGLLDHLAADVRVRPVPRRAEEQLAGRPVPEADTEPAIQLLVSIAKGLGYDALDVGLALHPLRPSVPGSSDAGLVLAPYAFGATDTTFPISDQVSLELTTKADLEGGIGLQLRPGQDPSLVTGLIRPGPGGDSPDASFTLALRLAAAPDGRQVLVSLPGVTLDAAAVSAGVGVTVSGGVDPAILLGIEDGRLVVAPDQSDGFLAHILPKDGITTKVTLDISWSRRDGLRIHGGAGLTTTVGLHTSIGPLHLDTLDLGLLAASDGLALRATLDGAADLGPFVAVVTGIGASVLLSFRRGNLGPVDLGASFIPPTGIGLSIDAGPVQGGGSIGYDPVKRRYTGELAVEIGDIGVTGLGILDAQLPGGAPGFALLISLRATFPAIQIGFGFALTSVGGLLALNRRIDVDALRQRLAAGTAGRILAPQDPIRNESSLLADLDSAFPVAPGVSVVGPTVQLVWAELVTFDIGVFIELPGPTRIVLLGSAHATVDQPGGGKPYLSIRVDIVGEIDLQASTASFDAALVDSQLLGILDITGGAAFRLSWGDQPYAVLTLGGFNPAYNPEPLVFPSSLTRIAMVHGTPNDSLYLRFEGYFAITTNTLQFGAAIQAVIQSGSFNVQGIVAFDALVVFEPFHFQFDIRASVHVRYKSHDLAGLTLTGSLAGPGPVVLQAKVCIELLFFDICFSDTFTLGSSTPPAVTTVASALDAMVAELERPGNFSASQTNDPYVVLRPPPQAGGPVVVSPLGQLVWVQRRAPIGLLLQRIGGAPLAAPATIDATSAVAGTSELDWFAPGSFADLSDDDALNRKAFERLGAGLRLGQPGTDDGPSVTVAVTVNQIRLPARASVQAAGTFFPIWLLEATAARLGAPPNIEVSPTLTLQEETWTVADSTGAAVASDLSQAQAHQIARLGTDGLGVATATIDRIPDATF
jgi:hypothetical protein